MSLLGIILKKQAEDIGFNGLRNIEIIFEAEIDVFDGLNDKELKETGTLAVKELVQVM
jgi:hypothetical protein